MENIADIGTGIYFNVFKIHEERNSMFVFVFSRFYVLVGSECELEKSWESDAVSSYSIYSDLQHW